MSWYKVTLAEHEVAEGGRLNAIQEEFTRCYIKAGTPSDMALFSDKEYRDQKLTLWFSPGCGSHCGDLIKAHQGQPCEAPGTEDVAILTGDDDVEDLLT